MFLPCYFWIAVTAGHVKRRPAILVSLMHVCAIFYKQLHHFQVSSQHSFMKRCHACTGDNISHQITSFPFLESFIFKLNLNVLDLDFSFCLWPGVESCLTWVKERVDADLPRPHESTDLLHISSSHDILEDDVIGEVHAPLRRSDGYDGCRTFPRLHALCWAVPWAFAVRGDVRWRGPVGGRVLGRAVVRRAVLRRCTILARQSVRRCALGRCIMCRAVIRCRVVCRWCVLWCACVRGYMVVVLHPCGVFCGAASPFAASPGGGMWEIQENTPVQQNPKILLAFFPLLSSTYYPSGFQLADLLLLLNKTFIKSTASLHNPIPLLSLERPPLESETARCLCWCLKMLFSRGSGKGPLYTLWRAILGPGIQWLKLRNEWPSSNYSHWLVTWSLTPYPPLHHKKCWQPKCCILLSTSSHTNNPNQPKVWFFLLFWDFAYHCALMPSMRQPITWFHSVMCCLFASLYHTWWCNITLRSEH